MAYIFGSIWDRFNRNALNDLSKSVEYQGKSIQDLVAKGQLTPEQYATLIQSVNGLISKGNVSPLDINKNLGKFDATYFSGDFLEDLNNGVIEATKVLPKSITTSDLDKGAVTSDRTTFLKLGKNIFNKNDCALGLYDRWTGNLTESQSYYSTLSHVAVDSNTVYNRSHAAVVIYLDSNYKYVSGTPHEKGTFTTPSNADFALFSVSVNVKDILQIEKGNIATNYEGFKYHIPKLIIGDEQNSVDGKGIISSSIGKDALSFTVPEAIPGKNLFNFSTIIKNTGVNQESGEYYGPSAYNASALIPIEGNQKYVLSGTTLSSVRFAYYDSNEKYISGGFTAINPMTSPSNAGFIAFSFEAGTEHTLQFEKGTVITTYSKYGITIPGLLGLDNEEAEQLSTIVLPKEIHALTGEEINIYFNNILSGYRDEYYIDVECSIGKHQKERWTAVPDAAGEFNLTIKLYDKKYKQIDVASTKIIVKAKSSIASRTTRALFIGSSSTASGNYTQELLNLYGVSNSTLNLIGTQGSGLNKHEGRGGWRFSMYHEDAESPFVFDGTFNFSQYISSNSFSRPDIVFFHLGMNDVFNAESDGQAISMNDIAISHLESMIVKIRNNYSDMKFGIILNYPAADQDAFGESYKSNKTAWRYKRSAFLAMEQFIKDYSERTGINIVFIQNNIDMENNMPVIDSPINSRNNTIITRQNNGLHMATAGYNQMADGLFYWMRNNGY